MLNILSEKILNFEEEIEVGNIFYTNGHYLKAKDIFLSILKKRSFDKKIYYSLGICFKMLKDFEKASFCFEAALFLDKDDLSFYLHLAESLITLGEKEKALSLLKKSPRANCEISNKIKLLIDRIS